MPAKASASQAPGPFPLPRTLDPQLSPVLAYWQSLRRSEAEMPFWDDLNPSALPYHSDRLMLIEASERPTRFRFAMAGEEIVARYGGDLMGKFVDEIEIRDPLRFIESQCSATIESRAPTYYRAASAMTNSPTAPGYPRLLLPMWGDGRIGMLLGAIAVA
jgi:hypothetical protein